jgi:hypothetical protein
MRKLYDKGMKDLDNKINSLQRFKSIIELIDTKHKNSYIHLSMTELDESKLFDINYNNKSWLNSEIYHNPKGLWFSCDSNWLKWVLTKSKPCFNNQWIHSKYIYEIVLNDENILHIKNYKELIKFHKEYIDNNHIINWKLVKKKYDGLIICPYLGFDIWNKLNDENVTAFHINENTYQHMSNILGDDVMKYPKIYLEWYRHWETGSGVVWRKRTIKKINLIYK